MTKKEDDPMVVACEPAEEDPRDERREVPQEDEDPVPEEAGYGYGV